MRTREDVVAAVEAGVDFVTADDPKMALDIAQKMAARR